MNIFKTIGIMLLIVGLAVILYGIFNAYNIFSGKTEAPQIFQIEKPIVPSAAINKQSPEAMMNDAISQQMGSIIPTNALPKILNMTSWSIFIFILFVAGGQISSLGIKLIAKVS
jgi:L-cystine uptake protein TcyP (sodium:dicarboxylate symporter family)